MTLCNNKKIPNPACNCWVPRKTISKRRAQKNKSRGSLSFQGCPKSLPVVKGVKGNSEEFIFVTPERPFLGVVFGQKEFSQRNGRLSPIAIACLTYSESYASKAQNDISWSNISPSCQAAQFLLALVHLRFYNI